MTLLLLSRTNEGPNKTYGQDTRSKGAVVPGLQLSLLLLSRAGQRGPKTYGQDGTQGVESWLEGAGGDVSQTSVTEQSLGLTLSVSGPDADD